MSHNEEGKEYDDTVNPRHPAMMPTDSTAAQGQTHLVPAPTGCKIGFDNECMYEELTGC